MVYFSCAYTSLEPPIRQGDQGIAQKLHNMPEKTTKEQQTAPDLTPGTKVPQTESKSLPPVESPVVTTDQQNSPRSTIPKGNSHEQRREELFHKLESAPYKEVLRVAGSLGLVYKKTTHRETLISLIRAALPTMSIKPQGMSLSWLFPDMMS